MKYKTQNEFPNELLKKLLAKSLDDILLPLEDKINQEILDLKYLRESSQQILKKITIYSSSISQQAIHRPRVIVIKKNTNNASIAKSSSPMQNNLNQTSRILNPSKRRMTIKPNKPSISHDKIIRQPKKKSTANFPDYSLTRAPTMKSLTPVSKRMDKSSSNTHLTKGKNTMNKKSYNTKLMNKTNISSTSNNSPGASINPDETQQINYNHNTKKKIFSEILTKGKKHNNDIDDMFLIQDKFTLTDIRFSKIPFLSNNNNCTSKASDRINYVNSVMESDNSNALTLGDQLEANWDVICKYISTKEILGLTLINKQLGVNTMNESITRIETEIERLDDEISKVKLDNLIDSSPFESSPNNSNKTNSSTKYEFNQTTQRAINLLNEVNMDKIFINTSKATLLIPCDDILTIYWLYFTIIQRKVSPINSLATKEQFWKETCEYFIKRSMTKLGLFIENEVKSVKINNEIIYKLDLYAMKNYNKKKLSPAYYQNMCNVTGIFVFVIKDVMDHLGIGKDNSNDTMKILRILNSRLEIKNKILMKLNNINERYLN